MHGLGLLTEPVFQNFIYMRSNSSRRLLAGCACAAFAAAPAAASDQEAQSWLALKAKFDLGGGWAAGAEAHGRFAEGPARFDQSQLRATLEFQPVEKLSFGAGYGRIVSNLSAAPDEREHRFWQEATWKPGEIAALSFALRARIEERFSGAGGGTGWRFRQRVKVSRAFGGAAPAYAYATGEAYVALNATGWGLREGFEQWRTGAGLGFGISDGLSLETGYLNILKPRAGAEDAVTHALELTLSVSY